MNNNQQPKPEPKGKAIASFWIGIISVIPMAFIKILFNLISTPYSGSPGDSPGVTFYTLVMAPFFILAVILGPIGLILGIIGLKSTKRNFAIAGIILTSLAIIFVISRLF